MKKTLIILITLFSGIYANAQSLHSLTLNAYGGYTFQERVPLEAFTTDVKGAFQYGAGLEYFVQRNKSIELKYLRMDTKFPLYRPNGQQVNEGKDDGAVNYAFIGGNNYFVRNSGSKIVPFAGLDIGVGWLNGNTNNSSAKFAWGAKVGAKVMTSSVVSFKLQAYIQSMVSTFGNDFWYYPGWGTYAVQDYATIFQFGLGGVVCFDFKKK